MARKKRKSNKKTNRQKVEQQIVGLLDASDLLPWEQPWVSIPDHYPRNALSGHRYSGNNFWMLGIRALVEGYQDCRWMTFQQAKARGGNVRGGENGTYICYGAKSFSPVEGEFDENGEQRMRAFSFLKVYVVFNVEQTEGTDIEPLDLEQYARQNDPIEEAAQMVERMPFSPDIEYRINQGGVYMPIADRVVVSPIQYYQSSELHYKELFHELMHSTGHQSRLDRQLTTDKMTERYGREELVAEMGAAMLCGELGMDDSTFTRHGASYIKGWLDRLKGEPSMVMDAARDSRTAVDWIAGRYEHYPTQVWYDEAKQLSDGITVLQQAGSATVVAYPDLAS